MAIKAVCFDIDGTLLNDIKSVQKSTHQAIKEMKKQGIVVGLATGRGPGFVDPFMDNLGLDFAITYNGQYIFTRDHILYQKTLPKSAVYKVIKYASDQKKEISLGTVSGLVGSQIINMGTSRFGQIVSRLIPKKMAKTVEKSFKHLIRRFKPQNRASLLTMMRQPIFQVVLVASQQETKKIEKRFPQLTVTRSSPYSADLISKNQSKLKGISLVGEFFGFDISEVMAFGDSDNDIEMLSGVGIGVAMGNASQSVKKIAHYITDTNNNDGISKALDHYGLVHLYPSQTFKSKDENFNKVKDFHQLMDGEIRQVPMAYNLEQASYRSAFKIEEIVEFLYATSQGNNQDFKKAMIDLHGAIDDAAKKVARKPIDVDSIVGQVDALTDLLYFVYGSFVLMGVDPKPFFDTVHGANMGKIFPDGKAHFDPITHKILKPDNWEERFAPEPAIKRELDRQIQKASRTKIEISK